MPDGGDSAESTTTTEPTGATTDIDATAPTTALVRSSIGSSRRASQIATADAFDFGARAR